ncbi:MAG: Hsp20/alpha crystallin family protein [Planctomycetes bacterium]|nr:Hsp20/alpha crystallin family protein [Planctomycetota bacterium]
MALIRGWVPAPGPFGELQREVNRVFDAVFGKQLGAPGRIRAGYVYPPMNIWETGDGYVVACEVPGLEMADLEVYVAGDQLTVSGRRAEAVPEQGVTLHRRERDSGHFSRAITLPGPVDSTKTEATLADGVLTVRIPKAEEAKPKRITVHLEG